MSQDRLIDAVSLSTVCEPDVFDSKDCFGRVRPTAELGPPGRLLQKQTRGQLKIISEVHAIVRHLNSQ
jgi:hypothetical protein